MAWKLSLSGCGFCGLVCFGGSAGPDKGSWLNWATRLILEACLPILRRDFEKIPSLAGRAEAGSESELSSCSEASFILSKRVNSARLLRMFQIRCMRKEPGSARYILGRKWPHARKFGKQKQKSLIFVGSHEDR